ncbi:MAG: Lrp/AsnC family transcriptional regulator [Desulfobacterales bacterium]|nr:Lrp/AsnC family transcriptional regulator [Desulfobacterales bacterium]
MPDDVERRIIRHLQGDLPLTTRPFAVLASEVGMSEEDLLERIRMLKKQGTLRRFGATLRHQLAGYKANAMVAWYVHEDNMEEIGHLMATFKEVSHCYERKVQGKWKYNLFTMIHGKSKKECQDIARRIAENTGIKDYVLLLSLKEFKKTSPRYF